jgi:hypothetical protein
MSHLDRLSGLAADDGIALRNWNGRRGIDPFP